MLKSKSTGRKENNKTNENSKPKATKKKLYRLLVKMVMEKKIVQGGGVQRGLPSKVPNEFGHMHHNLIPNYWFWPSS